MLARKADRSLVQWRAGQGLRRAASRDGRRPPPPPSPPPAPAAAAGAGASAFTTQSRQKVWLQGVTTGRVMGCRHSRQLGGRGQGRGQRSEERVLVGECCGGVRAQGQ